MKSQPIYAGRSQVNIYRLDSDDVRLKTEFIDMKALSQVIRIKTHIKFLGGRVRRVLK